MIGTVLAGNYRVIEPVDLDAAGAGYVVEHVRLGRRLTARLLAPDRAGDPLEAARFRREARALNRLRHPHVVGVEDFGQLPGGGLYLVLELDIGERLDALLARAPGHRLPVGRALELGAQLAAAIEHVHGRGVVHRDLAPANLRVVSDGGAGVLKVLGFGLSIVADAGGPGDWMSRSGDLFGTPAYLAPERLAGVHDDPRSDLYALGCILHELIAGSPPFAGPTLTVLTAQLSTAPPRLAERASGVPPALDDLVERLLAKEPGRRPRSAGEVEQELRLLARETAPPATRDLGERTQPAIPAALTMADRELRDRLCDLMVQVAERALAHAPDEPALVGALAAVRGIGDERARLDASRREVDAHHAAIAETARAREAARAVAISDLGRARVRASSPAAVRDLDVELETLSRQGVEEAAAAQAALADLARQGEALTAGERDLDARRVAAHRHLRAVLGPRFGGVAAVIDQLL